MGTPPWNIKHPVDLVQRLNLIFPPEYKVQWSAKFSSPVCWNRLFQLGGRGGWSPNSWNTSSPLTLFKKRDHHLSLPVLRHCPQLPHDAPQVRQPRQPYKIQTCEVLKSDFIQPWKFATEELPNYFVHFDLGDGWKRPSFSRLCFRNWRCGSGIEETLKVFLPPANIIIRWGQQSPTFTANSTDSAQLPLSEVKLLQQTELKLGFLPFILLRVCLENRCVGCIIKGVNCYFFPKSPSVYYKNNSINQ